MLHDNLLDTFPSWIDRSRSSNMCATLLRDSMVAARMGAARHLIVIQACMRESVVNKPMFRWQSF